MKSLVLCLCFFIFNKTDFGNIRCLCHFAIDNMSAMQLSLLVNGDSNSYQYDGIMGAMASQITSLTIVYVTVYSGADHRKHQNPASLAFVWGIHRGIPRTKGQ